MHYRLTRGIWPRLEGKQRTWLSSRVATRISWSPLSGLKGVNPLQFGERTRDCSPGHAGKEGPHLEMTGASRGFSRAAAPVWGFSRGTTGSSGSLSCGNREVRSPWAGQGGARHCSQVRVGESGIMTIINNTVPIARIIYCRQISAIVKCPASNFSNRIRQRYSYKVGTSTKGINTNTCSGIGNINCSQTRAISKNVAPN